MGTSKEKRDRVEKLILHGSFPLTTTTLLFLKYTNFLCIQFTTDEYSLNNYFKSFHFKSDLDVYSQS